MEEKAILIDASNLAFIIQTLSFSRPLIFFPLRASLRLGLVHTQFLNDTFIRFQRLVYVSYFSGQLNLFSFAKPFYIRKKSERRRKKYRLMNIIRFYGVLCNCSNEIFAVRSLYAMCSWKKKGNGIFFLLPSNLWRTRFHLLNIFVFRVLVSIFYTFCTPRHLVIRLFIFIKTDLLFRK